MHRWLWLALVGCGRFGFDGDDTLVDGSLGDGRDGAVPRCEEPWSAPFAVLPADTREPSVSADRLEIYASNGNDIVVSTRASRSEPFGTPVVMSMPPNTSYTEAEPGISDDGLELFISATVMSNAFTYHALRASVNEPFGATSMIGILGGVDVSHDRLSIYGSDYQAPIRVYRRPSIDQPFGAGTDLPAVVNEVTSANSAPSISSDDLDLYYVRNPGGTGPAEAWVAHRMTPLDDFSTAERIDIPNFRSNPDISADGHFVYYQGNDYGVWAISRCE